MEPGHDASKVPCEEDTSFQVTPGGLAADGPETVSSPWHSASPPSPSPFAVPVLLRMHDETPGDG